VPALEALAGLRVVADPAALDAARWTGPGVIVFRLAPDDAFGIGATGVDVADHDAIVEPETGFVGGWCLAEEVRRHLEWSLPSVRPVLAQGAIAGVPARVWLPDTAAAGPGDGADALVMTASAYADVLAERLGWSR
jgi:hypothetical protein